MSAKIKNAKHAPVPKKGRAQTKRRERRQRNPLQNMPVALSSTMSAKDLKNDPRNASLSNPDLSLSTQAQAIIQTVDIDGAAILGYAVGVVSAALQRGYAGTSNPQDPYSVTVYLRDLILSFMTGTIPMASSLPMWLLCLVRALAPKVVRMQQGNISYKWNITVTPSPPPIVAVGPVAFGYNWCVGIADVQMIDMFPQALTSLTYSQAEGMAAWASLAQQMTDPRNPWTKIVPVASTTTAYDHDVSVFSVASIPEGGGYSAGGWAFNAQNEVPIFNKLLATLVRPEIANAVSPFRYPVFSSMNCGDPIWTGAMTSTVMRPMAWGLQQTPRLHFIDFNEFGDVLAIWVTMIQNLYQQDPISVTANQLVDAGTVPGTICPLTLQEVMLLLRNVLMQAFKDTQPAVQSLYPVSPDSASDPQPVAFTCGANTCFLADTGMKLPQGFVENIRALVARSIPKGKNGSLSFIPVLGIIQGDVLNENDYQFSSNQPPDGAVITQNSFLAGTAVMSQRIVKNVAVMMPETATQISLVDGSFSNAGGAGFVFINQPARLKQLTEIWNEWIGKLSAYTDPLVTFGTEKGISILSSVTMTRHVSILNPQAKIRQQTTVDTRVQKFKYLQSAVYQVRQSIAITGQSRLIASPFEQVLSTWILPVNYFLLGDGVSNQTAYQRWQAIMGEPYSQPSTTGNDGILLSTNHANMAAKMSHTRDAPASDWQQLFDLESKEGRGGILSGLIASFAGDVLGPDVGAVGKTIASFLPF